MHHDDDGYHERMVGDAREQDRFLPVANIARIMKTVLPPNAKVGKDAKEAIQECVSEFISFITSEASDKCVQEKRKTINGDDILWAMSTLGFDPYILPLETFLAKYRDVAKADKPDKKPVSAIKAASAVSHVDRHSDISYQVAVAAPLPSSSSSTYRPHLSLGSSYGGGLSSSSAMGGGDGMSNSLGGSNSMMNSGGLSGPSYLVSGELPSLATLAALHRKRDSSAILYTPLPGLYGRQHLHVRHDLSFKCYVVCR